MQQLRATILSQTELRASKQRFALFSQPPPLAVGDDSAYKSKLHPRQQDGKPITQPRNFVTNPPRSGTMKSSYFLQPSSIYQGDPFIDPHLKTLSQQNKKYKSGKFHQTEFKPGSGFKTLASSSYKYIEQRPDTGLKKIPKDQNGRVQTQARNFQTSPCSKVQQTLLKFPKHLQDPYERKEQLQRQHNKKMIAKRGEGPFRSMSHGQRLFNKNVVVYGTEVKFPMKKMTATQYNVYHHEAVFRPANVSRGPLNRFPEFKPENPLPKPPPKKSSEPQLEKQEVFKPNRYELTRPTPSITLNKVNLRRSLK